MQQCITMFLTCRPPTTIKSRRRRPRKWGVPQVRVLLGGSSARGSRRAPAAAPTVAGACKPGVPCIHSNRPALHHLPAGFVYLICLLANTMAMLLAWFFIFVSAHMVLLQPLLLLRARPCCYSCGPPLLSTHNSRQL